MRDDFKELMDEVLQNSIHLLIVEKDNMGRVYLKLSDNFLLNVEGSLFLIPANLEIKIDEMGISIQTPEQCNNCKEECWSMPVGTEDEMNEYLECKANEVKQKIKTDIKMRPINLSIFSNNKGNC